MMHQRLSKWPQISACKFIISAAIASFLLMALFKVYQLCFVFEHECEMTYMYMKPQYIEVDLPNDIQAKYPQYELFVYGEGSYAADLKRGVLKGVPALYIPGNGGSYKQARSPASVALLMRPKEFQSRRIFNFFTVSFNEELSGLYGGVLQRQVEFVAVCVKHILSLYKHMNNPPSTIPLLGHSMGGVVARALFSLPSFPVESVHLIITLSSPHTRPILPLDTLMEDFYHSVDEVWQGSMTSHVTLVSFSSGPNDFQVLSPTTHVSSPNTINIPSTGVPRVWASTDHHEILWCRRLELALLRSLFQLQNGTAHELVKDPSIVRRTFCQHFMNPCSEFHPSLVPFPSRQLYPINTTTYVSGGHTSHGLARYLSFNLSQSAQWLVLSNVISLSSTKWLLGCNFTGKQCVDLSPWTASLPPIYYSKNKMMVVDTRQRSLQQLIVLEPPLDHKSHLIIEPYYRRQEVTLKLPVLSAEYDLSSKNHLILLPMDTAHDFVFVQLFEVQVLCAGLDTPSLDFIIAGFYPHGRLKSANLTSLHGSDVFQGKLQLSWQPESLNQSLLILLPSLQCKAKVLVSLDVEETVLQLTLHTVVLILKAVCSLLLLQVLWPAPSTTLSVWGLGLTISLLVCFSISYFGFNPTYIAVHCGVVLLYDLLTLVVSVGWHWINKICCKTLFRCMISSRGLDGNTIGLAAVVMYVFLASCSCGGVVLIVSLVASVLMMGSGSNPNITSSLIGGAWGVPLVMPTIISWAKLWIFEDSLFPPRLAIDPHAVPAVITSVLLVALVVKFKKQRTEVANEKHSNCEKNSQFMQSDRHLAPHYLGLLLARTALTHTCTPIIQVSAYLVYLSCVLYIKHLIY